MNGRLIAFVSVCTLAASAAPGIAQTAPQLTVTPGTEQQLTVVVPADEVANMESDLSSKSATTDRRRLWIAMPYAMFTQDVNRGLGVFPSATGGGSERGGAAAGVAAPPPASAPAASQSPSPTGSTASPLLSALTSRYKAVLLIPADELAALAPLRQAGAQAPVIAFPVGRMNEIANLAEPNRETANFAGPAPTPGSANASGAATSQDRVPVLLALDQLKTFDALPGLDKRQVTILLPFNEFPQVVNMGTLAAGAGR